MPTASRSSIVIGHHSMVMTDSAVDAVVALCTEVIELTCCSFVLFIFFKAVERLASMVRRCLAETEVVRDRRCVVAPVHLWDR